MPRQRERSPPTNAAVRTLRRTVPAGHVLRRTSPTALPDVVSRPAGSVPRANHQRGAPVAPRTVPRRAGHVLPTLLRPDARRRRGRAAGRERHRMPPSASGASRSGPTRSPDPSALPGRSVRNARSGLAGSSRRPANVRRDAASRPGVPGTTKPDRRHEPACPVVGRAGSLLFAAGRVRREKAPEVSARCCACPHARCAAPWAARTRSSRWRSSLPARPPSRGRPGSPAAP